MSDSRFTGSRRRLICHGFIGTLSLALAGAPAMADTIAWTGGGANNNWDDAANWGGTLPGAGDIGVIGAGDAAYANTSLAGDPAIEVHADGRLSIDNLNHDISGMT